jgi:UDP-N-acetylmuramate dehydrogenase
MRNPFGRTKNIRVVLNGQLADYTSMHIGGPAEYVIDVYAMKALKRVLQIIKKHKMRYFLIGAGTNLLVADRGFRGVVIRLGGVFKRITRHGNRFNGGGGLLVSDFLDATRSKGYGGAEFLAGIPGTLGGAVKGNAGAFGNSISDIVESVVIVDRHGRETLRVRKELGFTYRYSKLKAGQIVTAVNIVLRREKIKTISARIQRNIKSRQMKHPTGYSAGSFFKNPPGHAAGALIEQCGLKGTSVGDAEVSRKHANYIINRGNARASDVMVLAKEVKKIVRRETGIILEEEVQLLK